MVFILLLAACWYRSAPKTCGEGATAETASLQGVAAIDTSVYETLAMLPTTPVKDQGHNELCWLYAMTATIESEHAAQGDSVNIGVDTPHASISPASPTAIISRATPTP